MPSLFVAPTANFIQTTLNGGITSGALTITVNSATNFQAPGYAVIDRTDSNGTSTPNAREVISYTGISGSDLTGVTRGEDVSTARSHADGAIVETMPTIGMWNSLTTVVATAMTSDGYLKAINSPVSIAIGQFTRFVTPSIASVADMRIATRLDVSGASVTGVGIHPVWVIAGFSSAATTNVQRMIMPQGGTFQYFSMTTRTPVSTASLTLALYNIRSGASVFDTIGRPAILGGGTFVSTASIKTPAFISGDVLRVDLETGGNVSDITLIGRAA